MKSAALLMYEIVGETFSPSFPEQENFIRKSRNFAAGGEKEKVE